MRPRLTAKLGPPRAPRVPTVDGGLLPGAVLGGPRPVLVLEAVHYTPGRAPWDAVVRLKLEDLDELDEGWERAALRDAYGEAGAKAHSHMRSVLVDRTAPAMRRTRTREEVLEAMAKLPEPKGGVLASRHAIPPPPDDAPSVETGQWSRRKTDR